MARKQWIDFAAVREQLSFSDVLSHFDIDHPPGQKQLKIRCPFHEDRSPSCSISTSGKFNCFGCGAKGNTLDFIILMQDGDPENHADRYAAAETAISIIGRDVSDFGRRSGQTSSVKKQPPTTAKKNGSTEPDSEPETSASNPLFEKQLKLEHDHPFLTERGITSELAERYELGFCRVGLMRDRIAIRLHNAAGDPLGYVGRYAADKIPEDKERYLFPKGFQKSLELWNLHRALTLNKRYLVLVEGYWSAIRLQEMGIPAAALMGTSLSPAQAQLIRDSGIRHALLMLDGDEAGQAATPAAAHILSQHVYTRTINLPEGEKPDSVPATFLEQFV